VLGGSSIRLGTIMGIRVGVNVSWFFVLFIFIFLLNSSFEDVLGSSSLAFWTAVAAALGFFGSILLHELGHAVVARREGIGVTGIDLFFFGGVMKMNSDTRSPGQEFRVAVAGPLVTFAIIVVAAFFSTLLLGWNRFEDLARLNDNTVFDVSAFELWISFLVSMNVLLLLFNLAPAFPLDGGRIARAIVWKVTGSRNRATKVSGYLGMGFAGLLILYGIWGLTRSNATGGLWAIVLGYLLGSSARAAVAQSDFTEPLQGITVADVMDSEPVAIPADLPALQAWDDYFLRYHGWPWFAIVEADGRYAGLAHRAAVEHAALTEGGAMPVRAVASGAEDRVRDDEPIETLLGSEALRRLGALMAVDAEGRLRGVVTVEQVTRALRSHLQSA
jgi:Zn-dependent protease